MRYDSNYQLPPRMPSDMYPIRSLFSTTFVLIILGTANLNAASILFGIQQENAIAERLPYGPTTITESDSAFLNTSVGSQQHDHWLQRGVDGRGTLVYEINWEFSSIKSMAQRFQDAVDVGESVQWTVASPLITGTQSFSGTWRFSSTAGDLLSKFDGSSGDSFVEDFLGNGIWGAGPGAIDGTNEPISPGSIGGWNWGYGNLNGSDFFMEFANSGTLVLNGELQSNLPEGFKNLMFVEELEMGMVDTEPDGDVDGADFLALQRNDPSTISAWQLAYGTTPPMLSASTTVPEPASLIMAVLSSFLALGSTRCYRRNVSSLRK